MTNIPLTKLPTETLRDKSRALTREELLSDEIQTLIDDMIETMHVENGVGLAAPQIGKNIQLIIVQPTQNDEPKAYANAEILEKSSRSVKSEEGCLSISGISAVLQRSRTVTVKALDREANEVTLELDGFAAIVFQHEIDHINGVLIVDRAKKIF